MAHIYCVKITLLIEGLFHWSVAMHDVLVTLPLLLVKYTVSFTSFSLSMYINV